MRIALECLAIELSIHSIPSAEIEGGIEFYSSSGEHFRKTGDISLIASHDNLVHQLIFQYCDNEELKRTRDGLQHLINRGHQTATASRSDADEQALPEHLEILDALLKRDEGAPKDAMRNHLMSTLQRTLERWPKSVHEEKS
jgi:DNA-binding GntR family transcriptional regulator